MHRKNAQEQIADVVTGILDRGLIYDAESLKDSLVLAMVLIREQEQIIKKLGGKVSNYRKHLKSLQKAYEYERMHHSIKINGYRELYQKECDRHHRCLKLLTDIQSLVRPESVVDKIKKFEK